VSATVDRSWLTADDRLSELLAPNRPVRTWA